MDRWARIASALALFLLLASPAVAADAAPPSAEPAQPTKVPPAKPYWMLEEFDWGDTEEVVAESVLFDPYFGCTGDRVNPCTMVSAVVDRERLVARFGFHEGELWQMVFLTPDLAPDNKHLRRVWGLLASYMTTLKGKPEVAVDFPDIGELPFGPPYLTHFWSLPGLEARVMVGRRDVDLYYVGLSLSDPVRGKVARQEHLDRLTAADERLRQTRAARAAGKGDKQPGP